MKKYKPRYYTNANPKRKYIGTIWTALALTLIFATLLFITRSCVRADQPDVEVVPTQAVEETKVTEETESAKETEATKETEVVEVTEVSETVAATEAREDDSTKATETEPAETEPKHIHDYDITDEKEAECCTDGYVIYTCSYGDYFTKKVTSRGYHDWAAWKTVKTATTESAGLKQRTCKDCGKVEEKTIDKLPAETTPTETKPPATEPPVTEPPVTAPPATEPPATEAIACKHNWQAVTHPEEGHYKGYAVCKCGYRCQTEQEMFAHLDSFSNEDALLYHTSYAVSEEYVVDSPAYTEWVCSKCGAVTASQP